MKLAGKVALVTGSTRGLGRAIAIAMAQEGADVAITGRDLDKGRSVANEVESLGRRVVLLPLDISDSGSVDRAFKECTEKLGPLEILVNNAGIGATVNGPSVTLEEFDRVLGVNLRGAFLCCKAALPSMMERGYGRIVNVASTSAFTGSRVGDIPYAASKAGMVGLTRALANTLAARGITINAIAPGAFDTEILTRGGRRTEEEVRMEVQTTIPMGRLGQPEEVADLAVFLASDNARYITGQTIVISGGSFLH